MTATLELEDKIIFLEKKNTPRCILDGLKRELKAKRRETGTAEAPTPPPRRATYADFEAVYRKAMGELSAVYRDGTDDFIRLRHPTLWARILGLEERMNAEWVALGDLDAFKAWAEEWKTLLLKGLELMARKGFP